jgi:uncharacterized membrane protein
MKEKSILNVTATLLISAVWISCILFALKIFVYYGGDILAGKPEDWNKGLPGLYDKKYPISNSGIGFHFLAGAIILTLGSIQLVEGIRNRFINFHRWVGRVYVIACIIAAIGGLMFIFLKGTIGGPVMNIGFAGYGIIMLICAILTIKFARAGQIENHRAWAIRLYAMAIASWLYRQQYGLVYMLGLDWPQQDFRGLFDYFMNFLFYIPNLLVAEFFIRSTYKKFPKWALYTGSVFLLSATVLLGVIAFLSNYRFITWLFGKA